jgi:thiosulfate dehydrogenase
MDGIPGAQGPAGDAPSDDMLVALITAALAEFDFAGGPVSGDSVLGGKLFDNWPKVTGVTPDGEHGLWSLQSTNTRTGEATWRCKECHGWDYKGAGGAYSTGSHFTGFLGLLKAGRLLSQSQIVEVLHGGLDARHDFTELLTDEQITSLAAFVKTEIINEAEVIDYDTLTPRNDWDFDAGRLLYARTCSACHGVDGKTVNLGSQDSPVYIGGLASDNPWEFLHKVRFGQPGTPSMPAVEERGWTIEDAIALLGYSQSLSSE